MWERRGGEQGREGWGGSGEERAQSLSLSLSLSLSHQAGVGALFLGRRGGQDSGLLGHGLEGRRDGGGERKGGGVRREWGLVFFFFSAPPPPPPPVDLALPAPALAPVGRGFQAERLVPEALARMWSIDRGHGEATGGGRAWRARRADALGRGRQRLGSAQAQVGCSPSLSLPRTGSHHLERSCVGVMHALSCLCVCVLRRRRELDRERGARALCFSFARSFSECERGGEAGGPLPRPPTRSTRFFLSF